MISRSLLNSLLVIVTLACGVCYGAATTTQPCCNSCRDVVEAYRAQFWGYDVNNFEQCRKDGGKGYANFDHK